MRAEKYCEEFLKVALAVLVIAQAKKTFYESLGKEIL